MEQISKLQLYTTLVVFTAPIAFLETPRRLFQIADQDAWLAVIASIIPGILIVLLFSQLIQKSRQPFPLMLEEHLGKVVGKALSFIYILIFIFLSSYTIRMFADFTLTYVMPATPISVLIALLIIISFVLLKQGLTVIVRTLQFSMFIGMSISAIILVIAFINFPQWENLMPVANIRIEDFAMAAGSAGSVWSRLIPVLILAFYLDKKNDSVGILYLVLITVVLLIAFVCLVSTMTLGSSIAQMLTFPTFAMVRLLHIGEFLQHLDIFFVAVWALGTFLVLSLAWFMACYIAQQMLGLKEYQFIAAPTSLIIGVLSLLMSKNILELRTVSFAVMPLFYLVGFVFIPFIVWLFTLSKPPVESNYSQTSSGQ